MNTLDKLKRAEKAGARLIVLPVEQVRAMIDYIEWDAHEILSFTSDPAKKIMAVLSAEWDKPKNERGE